RVPLRHGDERQRLAISRRVDVRSGRNESIDDRAIVATGRPAMDGSERRPAERRAEVNGVAAFESDASALQNRLDQREVAHPACGVKRRAPIDATGSDVETEAQHEARCFPTAVED